MTTDPGREAAAREALDLLCKWATTRREDQARVDDLRRTVLAALPGPPDDAPTTGPLREDWNLVDDFPGWADLTDVQKGTLADVLVDEFWRGSRCAEDRARDALASSAAQSPAPGQDGHNGPEVSADSSEESTGVGGRTGSQPVDAARRSGGRGFDSHSALTSPAPEDRDAPTPSERLTAVAAKARRYKRERDEARAEVARLTPPVHNYGRAPHVEAPSDRVTCPACTPEDREGPWQPGDVILAGDGSIYTRRNDDPLDFDYDPKVKDEPWWDGGWMRDGQQGNPETYAHEKLPQPLTLLVRDARPVLAAWDATPERDALRRVAELAERLRGDGPCSRCGTVDHPVWFTESVFWNAVVRSEPLPWLDGEGDGLMCINCFVRLADERGYRPTGWLLLPEWHWETHDEHAARTALAGAGVPGQDET